MTKSTYPVRMINVADFRYECSRLHGDILDSGGSIVLVRRSRPFGVLICIDPRDEEAVDQMMAAIDAAEDEGRLSIINYRDLRLNVTGTLESQYNPSGVNVVATRNNPFGFIILTDDEDPESFSALLDIAYSFRDARASEIPVKS